ncbi:MAG: hypothetical protein ABWK53_08885 [Anaerolineales bacterium]
MIPFEISIKYLIAGYAAAFLILGLYVASLLIRWHSLKRDLETLEKLQSK